MCLSFLRIFYVYYTSDIMYIFMISLIMIKSSQYKLIPDSQNIPPCMVIIDLLVIVRK